MGNQTQLRTLYPCGADTNWKYAGTCLPRMFSIWWSPDNTRPLVCRPIGTCNFVPSRGNSAAARGGCPLGKAAPSQQHCCVNTKLSSMGPASHKGASPRRLHQHRPAMLFSAAVASAGEACRRVSARSTSQGPGAGARCRPGCPGTVLATEVRDEGGGCWAGVTTPADSCLPSAVKSTRLDNIPSHLIPPPHLSLSLSHQPGWLE